MTKQLEKRFGLPATIDSIMKNEFKIISDPKSFTEKYNRYANSEIAPLSYDDFRQKYFLRAASLYIQFMAIKNGAEHLYISDIDFCNWIVSCVKEYENEHLNFLSKFFNEKNICFHFPSNSGLCSFLAFIAPSSEIVENTSVKNRYLKMINVAMSDYIKTDEDRNGLIINTIKSAQVIISYSTENNNIGATYAVANPSNNGPMDCSGSHIYSLLLTPSEKTAWSIKLVIGIGMYMSCFPEQVKDGVPEDLKHPNHHKSGNNSRNRTIGKANEIFERNGPCPHYRTGHFRLLSSEFYKHKRGQVVFIRGTFVKGYNAKTVISIDNPIGVINVPHEELEEVV